MTLTAEHHPAFEEYCECIYELREDNFDVIQARIAERLDVSRPSVSEMIHRMESENLVSLAANKISLTDKGEALAARVVRRHRIAERFLSDTLGLSWSLAHHEACKWEHVLSPEVEEAIFKLMNLPTTCPHGNPIPGSAYVQPDYEALANIGVGHSFTVSRIIEEIESKSGALDFLQHSNFLPGVTGTIVESHPDGSRTVAIEGHNVTIDAFISERIFVIA